ncbi:metallophosphoesterase [Acidithiobacillus thiooxidans]|uniref:metallophosphoesterase n=1 Tax=Acidithiobacillus thiooxidans TaxID=930 RepID=UPI001C07D73B|nr:metallophosphoesterase [Acidithiobacillus thiooxidans]MBU2750179.1 phosphatase [Acidithiobacillus thiooxidans]MDR7925617.1 metallophosphoesterase [Acidithiobacillus thiooxidans]
MKIAFASDLHLEFDDTLTLTGLSNVDVLILASDVDVLPASYPILLRRLRLVYSGPVLFILGNHGYYHGRFPNAQKKFRKAIAEDDRAWLLENESVTINGVRFLGATLWTDFVGGRHLENCRRGKSDFSVIQGLTPVLAYQTHRESLDWLNAQFAAHCPDSTIVITHHARSFLSEHPRFAGSALSGGFCSNLDAHIQRWKPVAWIHGHLHDPADYRIGRTRILANPWGYPDECQRRTYRTFTV